MIQIEEVLACCLEHFIQTYPETTQAILKNKYFITAVDETKEQRYPSGIIDTKIKRFYFVDFTKHITLNPEEFENQSQELYREFKQVPKWYETG